MHHFEGALSELDHKRRLGTVQDTSFGCVDVSGGTGRLSRGQMQRYPGYRGPTRGCWQRRVAPESHVAVLRNPLRSMQDGERRRKGGSQVASQLNVGKMLCTASGRARLDHQPWRGSPWACRGPSTPSLAVSSASSAASQSETAQVDGFEGLWRGRAHGRLLDAQIK